MINSRPTFPIFRYNIGGRFFDRILITKPEFVTFFVFILVVQDTQ